MNNNFTKRSYIRVISFFVSLSIILCAATIVSTVRAEKYKRESTVSTERALNELCENLDNITVILEKGLYSNSSSMLTNVSTQLSRSSACAKVSLGQLTDKDMITDGIYKFLSQVGDFTTSLSKKSQSGQELTAKERENIRALLQYSKSLCDCLEEIRDGYFDSSIVFEKSLSNLSLDTSDDAALFSDKVSDARQSLADYPTLIYDGPFADSVLERESSLLKSKSEITAQEAKTAAAKFLGVDASSLRQDSDEISSIELYCFSTGEKSIGVTKCGAYLCYMTNPDYSGEETISEEEAIKRAKKYLSEIGYKNMKESYYTDYDGICTINFAYEKDGITYYADLIKVSVRMDTGEIAAIDARGYIMNHCERSVSKAKVSLKKAKTLISDKLTLIGAKKAMIPLESGSEKLCYEMHCKNNQNQEYLIYIDVATGEEDDILLLLYADGGTVTK